MKKSLKHLPQSKRDELQKIVAAIQKSCKDVKLFLKLTKNICAAEIENLIKK